MSYIQILEYSQSSFNTIRIRFSKPVPYMTGDTALSLKYTDDSQNLVDRYILYRGPTQVAINRILTVPDAYDCLDVETVEALQEGEHELTVKALFNFTGQRLENDLQTVTVQCEYMPVPPNRVKQASIEQSLRRYLSPVLDGPNFKALLAAFATGEIANKHNAEVAPYQAFMSTASERYLDRITANYGVSRPSGLGMVDSVYRKYATTLYNFKVTEGALYRMLEIFYGIDGVSAYVANSGAVSGEVQDGDHMTVKLDGTTQAKLTFFRNEFADPTAPEAIEVAVLISRKLQEQKLNSFCILAPADDSSPLGSDGYLRIYSGTLGLRSSVEVFPDGTALPWTGFSAQTKTLQSRRNISYIGRDSTDTMRIFLSAISDAVTRTIANAAYIGTNGWTFDPSNRFALTAVESSLDQTIVPNGYYPELKVVDASVFNPDGGFIVIGFGNSYQEGPIPYNSTNLADNALRIDTSYTFSHQILPTANVTQLNGNQGYARANLNQPVGVDSGISGSFYATNSNLARLVCAQALISMIDAGSKHKIQVVYPSDNGLLNAGDPLEGSLQLSDIVRIYGPNNVLI